MSISPVLAVGRTVFLEAATRVAIEGIRIIDERLDLYVRGIKRKKRGE